MISTFVGKGLQNLHREAKEDRMLRQDTAQVEHPAQCGSDQQSGGRVESPRPPLSTVLPISAIISLAFAGSVIVTPLYTLYQHKFGFSDITLTLVYAAYAIGNVLALLLFGQVSDQIGRKRAAVPALALGAVSAMLFLLAAGTAWLFVGRALIGLAVGVASGTGTAWLAEVYGAPRRPTATLTAATANLAGIGAGPLISGLLAQYVGAPLRTIFVVYIVTLPILAVVITRVPGGEGSTRSLREVRVQARLGVPRQLIAEFVPPSVCAFVIFALGGLYFALIPGLVIRDLHQSNIAIGGSIVAELAAFSALAIRLGRRLPPPTAMTMGLVGLLPSAALIVTAEGARSMTLLLIATALAGVTIGLGYRGSLEIVNEIAPDDRRAEVVSTYFIACFLGNSLPVIGLGLVSTSTTPLTGGVVFASVLSVLAVAALVWRRRSQAGSAETTAARAH
jgi:MFS family permease